jgi:hypothetical protein
MSYGRFNQIEGNAYISGPITDTLRGRVSSLASIPILGSTAFARRQARQAVLHRRARSARLG